MRCAHPLPYRRRAVHPIAHLSYEKYRLLVSAIASAGQHFYPLLDEAQQGHIAQHIKMATGEEVDA